jgi:biopolymer transport protein ExbD
MSNGLRTRRRRRPELPLVPLIDVLVMLVLFAFVSMRFSTTQTLNITLPEIKTAGKNQFSNGVLIQVSKSGEILVNSKPVAEHELPALLQQVKEENRNVPVLISADENTPLKTVTFVMDECRKASLNKFSLQAR